MFRAVVVGCALALVAGVAEAKIPVSEEMKVKDSEGNVFAVVVDCPQSDPTFGGSENGTIGPDRCGQCLIEANWGTMVKYPYDLHIKGTLLDEGGKPIANRMIEFFLPNGWVVKTRTAENGYFRILLGATSERKSQDPLTTDIGTKRMRKDDKAEYYALFLLQDRFKPCAAEKKEKKAEKKE
jgi:hypothetical protein